MTPEELLEAQKEQTPLVYSPPPPGPPLGPQHEIVTLYPHGPVVDRFVGIQRASGRATVYPKHLRIATAQDLLELGGGGP